MEQVILCLDMLWLCAVVPGANGKLLHFLPCSNTGVSISLCQTLCHAMPLHFEANLAQRASEVLRSCGTRMNSITWVAQVKRVVRGPSGEPVDTARTLWKSSKISSLASSRSCRNRWAWQQDINSELACLGVVEFYTGNAHEKTLIFYRPEQTSLSALQQASAGLKYAASAKISAGFLIPVQEGNLLGCRSTEIHWDCGIPSDLLVSSNILNISMGHIYVNRALFTF